MRSLVLGWPVTGWTVAPKTTTPDIVRANFIREVKFGEFITIGEVGPCSQRFAEARPKGCLFGYAYLACLDTIIAGRSVHAAHVEIGHTFACEHSVEADLMILTPDSDTPSTVGHAEASDIPFGLELMKNAYIGHTFIQPNQTTR